MKRTAKCCCKQTTIEIEGDPSLHGVCHCDNCKRRTGSAFGMCAWVSNEQIINKTGETYVYEKTSQFGDQKRFFCKNCGTTLYWTLGIWPDVTGIAGGCFVDPLPEPTVHVVQGGYVHPWIKLPEHWDKKNEVDGVGVIV